MMKKLLSLSLMLALPLLIAGNAGAANFTIDWGSQGYATEPGYVPHVSTATSPLTLYAKILSFSDPGPFSALNSTGNEYTLVISGMTSLGTVPNPPFIWDSMYSDGIFTIYEDAVADADFATPATFSNSPDIIGGTVSAVTTQIVDLGNCPPGATGSFFADFVFTGGSAVPGDVLGCGGDIDATWTDDDCAVVIPAGYVFQTNGHFSYDCQTSATEDGSWGNVKSLFR